MPSSSTQQTREDHFPDAGRVLFIGESPPAGGTFFYNANSNLYRATRDAFAAGARTFRDRDFLRSFQRAGCYLEDLAIEPVNGLPRAQRKQTCEAGIEPLADRIKPLTPSVVVIVGYGIADRAARSLKLAGHADVEREKLPFPTTRPRASDGVPYRQVYIEQLASLVARWRRRHILAD